MLPYKRSSEFRDRYLNSIIYYKGDPVHVYDISPARDRDDDREDTNITLSVTFLPYDHTVNKSQKLSAFDPGFYDTPTYLGYANAFTRMSEQQDRLIQYGTFLTRMPIRRSRQGVCSENLFIPRSSGHGFNDLLYKPGFMKMLKNEYPSFRETKELVLKDKDTGSWAFDPKFALEFTQLDQFHLYYKNLPVGYSLDGDNFVLSKGSFWLREILEEKGLKVS